MPRVRVIGPNGETGTVEQAEAVALPEGWRTESAAPPSSTNIPRPDAARPNYNRTLLSDMARAGVNMLPGVGAMGGMALGSFGGPPGAMLGALAGGKAGEWARYGLAPSVGMQQQMPPLAGWGDVANSALAGLGVGGRALGEASAPGLMRTGLKMMPTKREQWLKTVAGGETPEQAALRMGVSGLEKAASLKASTGRAQGRAILAAEQAGHQITAEDLAQSALSQAADKAQRVLTPAEHQRIVRSVAKQADELLNQAAVGVKVRNLRPRVKPDAVPFTPTQVATIKQAAQKIASPKFNQAAQGVNVKATPDAAQLIAEGARASLAKLPKVAGRTLENQKARLLTQALSRTSARQQTSLPQHWAGTMGGAVGAGVGAGIHGPFGAAVGAPILGGAGHMLTSPEAQRQLALALMNPFVQQAIQYGPLAASLPIRGMMTPPPMAPPDTLPPNPAWGNYQP